MGAGMMCIKYILCFFNFVLFLSGAAVLTVGIWLSVDKTSFTMLTRLSQDESLAQFNDPSVIEQGAYILIAAGALIFIIGFLGCCGSLKESRLMLGLYGGLMLVVFLLYIAAAILVTVYKHEAERGLKSFLGFTIKKWYSTRDKPNTITVTWNVAMAQLSCCGANNYTDFRAAERWNANKPNGQVVPASCCQLTVSSNNMYEPRDPSCLTGPTAGNSFYLVGCHARLLDRVHTQFLAVLVSAVLLASLQVALVFLSLQLCRAVPDNRGCYHAIKRHVIQSVNIVIGVCVALGALQLIVIILSFCLCKMIDLRADKF